MAYYGGPQKWHELRTAAQQSKVGQQVPKDLASLKPGDLLTFGRGKRITHVS